jgi:hypothetical protein
VEDILKEVANLTDFEVQQVFQNIAMLLQVSASIPTSAASLLADVFENSKDVSDEDLITPPRRSSRLVKTPVAKGTRRSTRKKQKVVVESSTDGGNCGKIESEYRSFDESDEEANSSNNDGGSEDGTQTGVGVRSSPASKPVTKKVCPLLPLLKRSVFALPSLGSGSSHVVENARIDLSKGM